MSLSENAIPCVLCEYITACYGKNAISYLIPHKFSVQKGNRILIRQSQEMLFVFLALTIACASACSCIPEGDHRKLCGPRYVAVVKYVSSNCTSTAPDDEHCNDGNQEHIFYVFEKVSSNDCVPWRWPYKCIIRIGVILRMKKIKIIVGKILFKRNEEEKLIFKLGPNSDKSAEKDLKSL